MAQGVPNTINGVYDRLVWEGSCLLWTGTKHPAGYGRVSIRQKRWLVHKLLAEVQYGPMEEGKELHHMCWNKLCCNLAHLEVVSRKRHTSLTPGSIASRNAKRTTCVNGHPFDKANTKVDARGYRHCLTCYQKTHRECDRRRRERKKRA